MITFLSSLFIGFIGPSESRGRLAPLGDVGGSMSDAWMVIVNLAASADPHMVVVHEIEIGRNLR